MVRRNWSVTIIQSYCSLSQPNAWRYIHAAEYNHIVPFLSDWQHGFRPDPALPNSPLIYNQWAKAWDEGPQIDVISLDLAKEFEQVPQNILLQNSCNFSISGSSLSWYADFLSNCEQQVVIDGVHSCLHPGVSIFCYFH